MSDIQAYHLAFSEVIKKINNDDYCKHCIHWDSEEDECDFKECGRCDVDSMERAIVRMIEEMKK